MRSSSKCDSIYADYRLNHAAYNYFTLQASTSKPAARALISALSKCSLISRSGACTPKAIAQAAVWHDQDRIHQEHESQTGGGDIVDMQLAMGTTYGCEDRQMKVLLGGKAD